MNREDRRKLGLFKQKAAIENSNDIVLQPIVIENRGSNTVYFTSKLEEYHPNLIEDIPSFELLPGTAMIQPHGYYEGICSSGKAEVVHYMADHPKSKEVLKDYKKLYRKRLLGASRIN